MLRSAALALLVVVASAAASDGDPSDTPPTARLDLFRMLQDDLAATRHPGDGGGKVLLVDGGPAIAGTIGRWAFEFTTGPHGIAAGGRVFFQVSPFWGWTPPQTSNPDGLGYTTFVTEAPGVILDVEVPAVGLAAARIQGRSLEAGERVRVEYGAGRAGARVDRYAERDSTFWFAVDADGDGVRALLEECPTIAIRAGPAARLVAHLPSVARPHEPIRLTVAPLDANGNAPTRFPGPLTVTGPADGVTVGAIPDVETNGAGHAVVSVTIDQPGVHRLEIRSGGLETRTNPIEVTAGAPRILWGDLHGHSNRSDGTGHPDDYFAYARDVAGLDVASLTDHDHWGMRPLVQDPEGQRAITSAVSAFDEPGRFVALPGFEWTSWLHGHRHVLFFDDRPAEILSSLDPATTHPAGLWRALAGRAALTIAHHTAGGPVATNWNVAPDPHFEPVTEVVSVHGSSEAEDSPARIYSAVRGHFARDALGRGYRLGFVGSGDGHDGHPGLSHLGAPTGGLVALVGAEPTRASVLTALRERRVYATSGPRIILRFAVDDIAMGGTIAAAGAQPHTAFVAVVGTARLARVELIRSGAVVSSRTDLEDETVRFTTDLPALGAGEYVYVRVVQDDGGLAWSSPIFAE